VNVNQCCVSNLIYMFFKIYCHVYGGTRDKNNGSDDWIYSSFFVQSLLITSHTALSLIYTLSSSQLNTHSDSQSPLVVSWQQISTQKLSRQICMKFSCHFLQLPIPKTWPKSLPPGHSTGTQLPVLQSSLLATSDVALYSRGTDKAENTVLLLRGADYTENTSHMIATQLVHWRSDCCLATS
jgi:hypothetical protein